MGGGSKGGYHRFMKTLVTLICVLLLTVGDSIANYREAKVDSVAGDVAIQVADLSCPGIFQHLLC